MPQLSNSLFLDDRYIRDCKKKINYMNHLKGPISNIDNISNNNKTMDDYKVIKINNQNEKIYKRIESNKNSQ